jgi:CBS domain-containing protein
MHHYVKDWKKSPIIVVDPDSSVSHALTLMRRRGIHSLVVDLHAEGNGYGILTSTDIRDKIIGPNRNPADIQVREVMTAPVITAHPAWTLVQCSQTMQSHNFHHLPVADDEGNLVGMISASDLFIAAEEIGWGKE